MDRPMKKCKMGTSYIPSYMDLTNGPEPCVVCGDAATGYHYRCMTCEGCKGFFRRTIQKKLSYHCKWNDECVIDKSTRNQCQQCRYRKCLSAGMAPDLVLNETQRKAKRRLIQENRDKRTQEETLRQNGLLMVGRMTESERNLIKATLIAHQDTMSLFRRNNTMSHEVSEPETKRTKEGDETNGMHEVAEIMTPSIVKVVEFAKRVPGFKELDPEDQIILLKSCCLEIMCLRIAQKYDPETQQLAISKGISMGKSELKSGEALSDLVEPILDFATGLSRLQLTETEMALLAAVLLIAGDRQGLKDPKSVEGLQDTLLAAFQHFINETRSETPVHWAKILMKITDLRTISARHAERLLCVKLDKSQEIPPIFLEMFDDCNTTL